MFEQMRHWAKKIYEINGTDEIRGNLKECELATFNGP